MVMPSFLFLNLSGIEIYMKKILLLLGSIPSILLAQIPSGYYDQTAGLQGYALKSALHEIISKKTISYNYSDVISFYEFTDLDHYYENDGTVLDLYSEKPDAADAYNYNLIQNISSASQEGQGWNREHGMPQSTFYGLYPMYSDLNYLIPTDAYINQRRSNYPYARNNGSTMTFTNGSKLGKSTTPGYSNTVYEPIDEFKGDIARYLLYFVVRYEGSLNNLNYLLATSPLDGSEEKGYEDWYIQMLKEWNTLDPVSQREIDRNNEIFLIQKTRNPFIDHPEYIDAIWNIVADSTPPNQPTGLQSDTVDAYFIKLKWNQNSEQDLLGYKVFLNGELVGFTKNAEWIADRLQPSTSYNFTVQAYDAGYLDSQISAALPVTTTATTSFAKDLMVSKYIEGSTNNTAIEINNKTGHDVLLNHYYLSIQFKGANDTYYFSDAYQLEGSIKPGERKVILNPKSTFSDYGIENADFVTNATPMTFTGTQYVELSYGKKYLKTVSTNNYDMAYTTVDAVGFKGVSNTNNNKSLYRQIDVQNPTADFNISEWIEHPSNYTDGLGQDWLASQDGLIANNLQIYPNPVQDLLNVKGTDSQKITVAEIYDLAGILIKKIENPFKKEPYLNLKELTTGVYILVLDEHRFRIIKK